MEPRQQDRMGLLAGFVGLHAAWAGDEAGRRLPGRFACAAADAFGTDSQAGATQSGNVAFPDDAGTGSPGSVRRGFANDTATGVAHPRAVDPDSVRCEFANDTATGVAHPRAVNARRSRTASSIDAAPLAH